MLVNANRRHHDSAWRGGDGLLTWVCDARLDSVAEQPDLVVHAEFVHHMGPAGSRLVLGHKRSRTIAN